MIAYTNKNQVTDSKQAGLYLHTLRLSLVKTVIPYSKFMYRYRHYTHDGVTMYHAKRRFIHNIYMDRSPFVLTCYNFDHIFTLTWTIEFTEVNSLPASK